MKLTTKRIEAGKYHVLRDGKATNLLIERGDAPRWGTHQEWWVCPADDTSSVHFKARGKSEALAVLENVIVDAACSSPRPAPQSDQQQSSDCPGNPAKQTHYES